MGLREWAEETAARSAQVFSEQDRRHFADFRAALSRGEIRTAERTADGSWMVHTWVKQAILLGFRMGSLIEIPVSPDWRFFDKDTLPLRNELMTKQLELRTLWSQTTPDQEKILAKQREINTLKGQLQEKATKHQLEMRSVLTPEQQAQWGAHGFGPGSGRGMRGEFGPRGGGGWGRNCGNCPRW